MNLIDDDHYPVDDAVAAFCNLSAEHTRGLRRAAIFLAGLGGFVTPEELISESYIRIADGKRPWPRREGFLPFVAGVMRSLLTDRVFLTDERKVVHLKQKFSVVTSEDLPQVAANDDDEDLARKVLLEDAISKLEAHFSGDGEMEMLLMGVQDGLRGKELQEVIGVDAKRLEALRTKLNRQIDKLAVEYEAKEGRSL